MNVAFKCTCNDGGNRDFVGFEGICTIENIKRNVSERPRVWCSQPGNLCRQFLENGFQGDHPHHPCYESRIFTEWRYGPGVFHNGDRAGDPIPMNLGDIGDVALLTMRLPDYDAEPWRMVCGAFEIVGRTQQEGDPIWLHGDPETAIRLPRSAALALPYWRFKAFPGNGQPTWGSGLFRSITDQEVSNFLHALRPFLQSPRDRMVLEHLLECCGNLPRDPGQENRGVTIPGADTKEKYGPGGEGEPRRQLKNFIADNPHLLNMGPGVGTPEHRFVTGDRVDVVVDLVDGQGCVVEVEVEGQSTMVGAHQALKYRALRAGELDNGQRPYAFLVAYSIPNNVMAFCERRGVQALEFPVDPVQ